LANLEANIDFASEDIEVMSNKNLIQVLYGVEKEIKKLISSYKVGRVLNNGLKIVILGRPNVGKSSLFNQIVSDEKAIVTEVPGTTRDLIESKVLKQGVPLNFIDTAGLHKPQDKVESIGIEKARTAVEEADHILYVFEAHRGLLNEDRIEIEKIDPQKISFVVNKLDLLSREEELQKIRDWIANSFPKNKIFEVSSYEKTGLETLNNFFIESFTRQHNETSALVSQKRHYELLLEAEQILVKAKTLLFHQESPDFIAFELQEALKKIHEILGIEFDDQVMDRVFQEFCIGK